MNRILSLLLVAILSATNLLAQRKWHNPQEAPYPVVQNRVQPDAPREGFYHRLPAEQQSKVRGGVWHNSKHAAGECIRFQSNASDIIVRYTVKGHHAMAHMPATGVSGIDLYTSDKDGNEIWLAGRFAFKDTITYTFSGIEYEGDNRDHRYTLFLPLYNEVEWLSIGTNEKATFSFEPLSAELPIVAYGTSICHGACASRPGMAWTNILQRRMGRNVVNLGFSGNALLESAVIDILAGIEGGHHQHDHGDIQEDEHQNGEDAVCLLHAMTPPSSSAPKRFMMPVQTNTSSISTRLRAAPRLGLLPCLNWRSMTSPMSTVSVPPSFWEM